MNRSFFRRRMPSLTTAVDPNPSQASLFPVFCKKAQDLAVLALRALPLELVTVMSLVESNTARWAVSSLPSTSAA